MIRMESRLEPAGMDCKCAGGLAPASQAQLSMRQTMAIPGEHFGLNITHGGVVQLVARVGRKLQSAYQEMSHTHRMRFYRREASVRSP